MRLKFTVREIPLFKLRLKKTTLALMPSDSEIFLTVDQTVKHTNGVVRIRCMFV